MSKQSLLLMAASLVGVAAGTSWYFVTRPAPSAPAAPTAYAEFVAHLGVDETIVRDELNELISTASARLEPADRVKAGRLASACLDARVLMEIEHVRTFVAARGEGMAYHFVNAEQRRRLQAIAGGNPTPARVLAVRRALATLGAEFNLFCTPPDWTVKIEGATPPRLPIHDLLRAAHTIRRGGDLEYRVDPRLPAFSSTEGELLMQLEAFFNDAAVRAALPPDKCPKLYVQGRLAAIPTGIAEYSKEIGDAVAAEYRILLPGDDPDADSVAAINEIYGRLERFVSAIISFDK